jgi:vacuolar-type H+-ATPase subunit E/Vma4
MLIPQLTDGELEGNHVFKKPYAGYKNAAFQYAGINKNLDKQNSKYAKLMQLDKEMDDALVAAANKALKAVQPAIEPEPKSITRRTLDNLLGDGGVGAFGAMRGAFFEGIIEAISGGSTKDKNNTLDINMNDANGAIIKEIFGLKGKYKRGDYKNSYLQKDKYVRQVIDNLTSTGKALKGRSASGYIPNFAGGALEDAIQREQAAGLPVNQIRINQSGKLRNAQNPMGLAVTNTRDEPTGAIPAAKGYVPNFMVAVPEQYQGAAYGRPSGNASSNAQESGLGKFVNIVAENGSKVTTTMFAFDGLKNAVGGTETSLGSFIGKLGPYAVGVSAVVAGLSIFADHVAESSGANAAAADATDKLAKAAQGAALSLDKLDKRGQREVTEEAKRIFEEGSVYGTTTKYVASQGGTFAYQKELKAKFEADPLGKFKETDLEKSFQQSISEFLASGAASDDVRKRVEKISEDGLRSVNEVLNFADEAAKAIKESTKRVEKFISEVDLTDMQKEAIANAKPERLRAAFKGGSQAFTGVKEALEKEGIYGEEAQLQAIDLLKDSLNKKEQERTDAIAQIELSRAKANISSTIELAKLKLQTLSVDEKRLIQAQALNNISLKELINLENIVEAKKFDVETSQQLLDKTNEYLEGLKGITAKDLNREEVQKR